MYTASSTSLAALSIVTRRSRVVGVILLLPSLLACSGLKEGTNDRDASTSGDLPSGDPGTRPGIPGVEGPGSGDAQSPISSGALGPGPFGALPNGYCCNTNEECRSRTCETTSGGTMCRDRCSSPDGCLAAAGTFTCEGGRDGKCAPDPGTRCIASAQFVRGTKKLGDCCLATHDATAGLECEGGHCGSFGKAGNPYICYQVCSKASDCPGPYLCTPGPYNYKICIPESGESTTCGK